MIYVLKTSVKTKKSAEILSTSLSNLLGQAKWNFDLDDCDHILRVKCTPETLKWVIKLLLDNGFDCEELAD